MKSVDEVVLYKGKSLFSWLDINPVELCNRTCEFCPRGINYLNQDFHISQRVIEKLGLDLEEINFEGTINICGNGEPLLCDNLLLLVSRLKDFNLELVTNGDLLTEKSIYDLFDNDLNFINVSLYDGEHQVDKFNELFLKCGILKSKYFLREYWKGPKNLANRAGFIKNNKNNLNKPCYYMHYSMQIDWNGDVLFCIQDIYGKTRTFGNVKDKSLLDIWNSDEINKYRELLGDGKRTESPCNNCDALGIIHGYNHYLEWNKNK